MLCTLQHCATADILHSNPQKLVGLPKILLLLQEAKDQYKDEALKGGGVFTAGVINTSATGLMSLLVLQLWVFVRLIALHLLFLTWHS